MVTRPAIGTLERARGAENRRIAAVWLGTGIYGVCSVILISSYVRHFELAVIALELLVLLPALAYALFDSRHPASTAFEPPASTRLFPYLAAFLLVSLVVGYLVGRGILIPDESGYRFQATVFANGELSAPAPWGATNTPDTPRAVNFVHQVVYHGRWFSKYPVGWPAVLALPEMLHFGWAAAPLLGVLLLIITGLIAKEAFGPYTAAPTLWVAVLSPYWLATCAGRLSEALCAVLVATACLCCLRGLRDRMLQNFAVMYLLLVPSFLVRPFTALITSAVLGIAALLWSWRKGAFLRTLLVSAAAGASAVALTLLFNFLYTGRPLLSPYALYKGIAVPNEITASPSRIIANLVFPWRFSAQSMLVFTFPFIFVLAIYGLWASRRSWAAWIMAAIFPALAVAYLADSAGPSSLIGERYWFEGYFGIAILAGQGIVVLLRRRRVSRRVALAAVAALTCAQAAITVATAGVLYGYAEPYAAVRSVAERYSHCYCAVFVADSPPEFYSRNMDMNTANWRKAAVFYFNDPGPEHRPAWASLYGRKDWIVITYNPATRKATAQEYKAAPDAASRAETPGQRVRN
jgi:hypothetical protein